jgi:phenylpropionate dioxygenase-like ring-hydroxylating dioxygenase large terminal subunit
MWRAEMSEALENDPVQGDQTFPPGEYVVQVPGERSHFERKSPPLVAFQPHRDRNLKVDPRRYTSHDAAALEWERLWPNVWLCAGRVSDIPKVGSFFLFNFGVESIIIVRSDSDKISALYNVCQHRGHQLVTEEFGEVPTFLCGYHSWLYDLSGRNRRITDRHSFRDGALCGQLDMKRLRCEVWGGNVFINMNEKAIPLTEYLGEVADFLNTYQLERMTVAKDIVVEHECNWKVVLDAFSEAYHTHIAHREILDVSEDRYIQHDFYKYGHSRQWAPMGDPAERLKARSVTDSQRYMLKEAGLNPEDFAGRPYEVRAALQRAKRERENRWGIDYSAFSDSQLTDTWVTNIFPNLQIVGMPEGILMQRYIPHPTDPNRCHQHIMGLVPPMKPGVRG